VRLIYWLKGLSEDPVALFRELGVGESGNILEIGCAIGYHTIPLAVGHAGLFAPDAAPDAVGQSGAVKQAALFLQRQVGRKSTRSQQVTEIPQRRKPSEYMEYIGLFLALAGLGQLALFSLFSLFVLFFGALIMCGNTLYMLPFSFGAVILGWLGRKGNSKVAWTAIVIGLLLVPLSLAVAIVYAEILGRATA